MLRPPEQILRPTPRAAVLTGCVRRYFHKLIDKDATKTPVAAGAAPLKRAGP